MPQISVDSIIKLPDTQKALILGGIIAAMVGLYVYISYLPNSETLSAKRDKLAQLQAELNEQKKVVADLPRFEKELKEMEGKFKEALTLLPDKREIPSLLTNISNLARNSGLEILLFQPKAEIPKSFYADIPVEMEITGKYHDLGLFFDRISKLPRIVNISGISMKQEKSKKTAGLTKLNASFQALTFKFLEEKKPSGKKSKRSKRKK